MPVNKKIVFFTLLAAVVAAAHASGGGLADEQAALVIQIGALLFAVKAGGLLAQRFRIPGVLGELLVGVAIGPYALGGLALPGFPHGLFGTGLVGALVPVSTELYAFSTVASIILLFISGLETDLSLFIRYSVAGVVVGVGGVAATFVGGALIAAAVFGGGLLDAQNLMFGIMATATSIGITARILSERKKLDTPEGVTTLAAAVFDDVMGIVLLAVVLGVNAARQASGGGLAWGGIGMIALRAFGLWFLFTALGLVFSKRIATILKSFGHRNLFTVLALGMALLLAGFFEKEGLAMIIGAYVMGLSLSKSDISHIIVDRMRVLYEFFVPIFFAVMGMLVDLRQFADPRVLAGGLAFTAVAMLGKLVGCGGPALLVGFNAKGALRIGLGMMPRGEVVLILAGIGLATGMLPPSLFGVAVMLPLVTALLTPPLLNKALLLPGRGTRKESRGADTAAVAFEFPSPDIATLVTDTMAHQLQAEGFFVRTMDIEDKIAQVRKDDTAFSIKLRGPVLEAQGPVGDLSVAQTAVFEAVAALNSSFSKLKKDFKPGSLDKELPELAPEAEGAHLGFGRAKPARLAALSPFCVSLDLKGETKEEVVRELLGLLKEAHKLDDVEVAFAAIMEREASMSTGMQDGIALPHAKIDGVEHLVAAVGLKPGGMDFASLDGKPTNIVVLSLSPTKNPESHLQYLAAVGKSLRSAATRAKILAAPNPGAVAAILDA